VVIRVHLIILLCSDWSVRVFEGDVGAFTEEASAWSVHYKQAT